MKANYILIFGSVVTIILILLWHFKIVGEPIAALGGALLTLVGYLLTNSTKRNRETKNPLSKKDSKPNTISQSHFGIGDIIGRDKIIKK